MKFGSLASMIGAYEMQKSILLFENTFDRTLPSVVWLGSLRIIVTVPPGQGLGLTRHLSG